MVISSIWKLIIAILSFCFTVLKALLHLFPLFIDKKSALVGSRHRLYAGQTKIILSIILQSYNYLLLLNSYLIYCNAYVALFLKIQIHIY